MIKTIQLILSLSILVIIHELGHFLFARLFKVRVEKFYMFFNPRFALFRAKKFDGKWHFRFFARNEGEDGEWAQHPETTEWGIGWVPFGGYCAIAGMVDETHSSDEINKQPAQDWEFRSKNVWQRMCIILGGIFVNLIGALVIFSAIFHHWGQDKLPLQNIDRGLYYSQILVDEGFRQQDKIISINGETPEVLSDVFQKLIIEGKQHVLVLRGEDTIALTMSSDLGNRLLVRQNDFSRAENQHARRDPSYKKRQYVVMAEYFPFVVDSVIEGTAADYAHLQKGDSLVMVENCKTGSFAEVQNLLAQHPCDSIIVGFYRGGIYQTTSVFLGDQCQMGVFVKDKLQYFQVEHTDYGFFASIKAGVVYGWETLAMYVKQFRLVFSKEGAQSLGGFGAIGSMFPSLWDWYAFWHMTAFLSLILAFMNFLPIPALDGGYFLFLLFELITGKQPGDKFLERANIVGFWLLILLMIFANFNDIIRFFF